VVEMSSLFFGETGEFCPHSAACTPTHPQIALKLRIAEIILQVPHYQAKVAKKGTMKKATRAKG
jgi:hypothetical protein